MNESLLAEFVKASENEELSKAFVEQLQNLATYHQDPPVEPAAEKPQTKRPCPAVLFVDPTKRLRFTDEELIAHPEYIGDVTEDRCPTTPAGSNSDGEGIEGDIDKLVQSRSLVSAPLNTPPNPTTPAPNGPNSAPPEIKVPLTFIRFCAGCMLFHEHWAVEQLARKKSIPPQDAFEFVQILKTRGVLTELDVDGNIKLLCIVSSLTKCWERSIRAHIKPQKLQPWERRVEPLRATDFDELTQLLSDRARCGMKVVAKNFEGLIRPIPSLAKKKASEVERVLFSAGLVRTVRGGIQLSHPRMGKMVAEINFQMREITKLVRKRATKTVVLKDRIRCESVPLEWGILTAVEHGIIERVNFQEPDKEVIRFNKRRN